MPRRWWAQVDSNHRHIIAYALGLFLVRLSPRTVSGALVGSSGLEPPTHKLLMRSVIFIDFRLVLLSQHAGGLKWTRTTDLPLIRRVL